MLNQKTVKGALALFVLLLIGVSFSGKVFAGPPQLDSGAQIDTTKPYESAQYIKNIFGSRAIYGKLEGKTPVDIYSFKADVDGEQTFSLLTKKAKTGDAEGSLSQAVLILMDSTDKTESDNLSGLPVPSDEYHPVVITATDQEKAYNETFLLQQYNVTSERKVALQKGATYYLVVLDPYRLTDYYAIKLGEDKAWTFSDVFTNFGSWFRLQTNNYAKSSPFTFSLDVASLIIFLLGFAVLAGVVLIQETFSFLANKSKAAGYVLIKMQPYSRIYIWVSLWFMAMGGYMLFDRVGWTGIPFVLGLLFIPILINMLYLTLVMGPRIANLEVTKKEATIPFSLRKRWFISSLVSLFTLGAFLVFLSLYLNK